MQYRPNTQANHKPQTFTYLQDGILVHWNIHTETFENMEGEPDEMYVYDEMWIEKDTTAEELEKYLAEVGGDVGIVDKFKEIYKENKQ